MKKVLFIKNAAILTLSSLFLRMLGMVFRIYISNKIGAQALGLYQLIFSVHVFGATLATAGFSVGVTRLIAGERTLDRKKTSGIMKKSLFISVIAGFIAAAVLYFGADMICTLWIQDERALPSVQIFAFSLPFMSISCCYSGYFLARKKAGTLARSQIFEQVTRIVITYILLKNVSGMKDACAAVVLGDVISEVLAAVYLAVAYKLDIKTLEKGTEKKKFVIPEFLKISLPIAGASYIGSFLRMTENLIVPESLEKSGFSRNIALEKFGTLKGVVLPIIFFPSAFLGAISSLLIPEIAHMKSIGNKEKLSRTINTVLQITVAASIFIANIFYLFADELGSIIYNNAEVGHLLKVLSVITPLMYLESIVDGILKGLDMQMHTFKLGIMDSLFRIAAILVLVPVWGMTGFITVMICSNVASSLLSTCKLPCKIKILPLIKPVFAAVVSSVAARLITVGIENKITCLAAGTVIYSIVYLCVMYIITPVKRRLHGKRV